MVFRVNRAEYSDQGEYIKSGRRCGTPLPNALEIDRVRGEVAAVRQAIRARPETVTINVQFTHITDGNQGNIEEDQRRKQIEVMNRAYSESGIKFTYEPSSARTVNKPAWFNMGLNSAAERESKTELHVPPEYSLNLYTAGLQNGILGWARFPWDLAGDKILDGVVILWSTFPGGEAEPYNLGQTCTHEVGHWLGLYHTFQDGCGGNGDEVDDTPTHGDPNYGCLPDGRNGACSPQEKAPIHNYMNYSDDVCMTEFSKGQIERMKDLVQTYRSTLVIGPNVSVAAAAGTRR
jgi:Pregnancy-associated plasma protein-A